MNETAELELLACVACKEHAATVSFFDGGSGRKQPCYIVRPYRKSKCKHYRPGCLGVCQFISYGTPHAAIAEWNARQAGSEHVIERAATDACKAMTPEDKKLISQLVSKLIDLRCPHCGEAILTSIEI